MGMFDMASTTGLKEAGNVLSAGIHDAKFKSIAFENFTAQNGTTHEVMNLTLDVEGHGEWVKRFFNPAIKNGQEDPTATQRTDGTFGQNPSRVEQFMVSLRQIIDALDPEIGKKLDADDVTVNGKKIPTKNLSFAQLVKLIGILTEPYAGTDVKIKLVPQGNGFNDFPGFPARINRAGMLGIASRFIANANGPVTLVLSQSEQKKIEAAANSRPTNMNGSSDATLEGVGDALGLGTNDDTDLPF